MGYFFVETLEKLRFCRLKQILLKFLLYLVSDNSGNLTSNFRQLFGNSRYLPCNSRHLFGNPRYLFGNSEHFFSKYGQLQYLEILNTRLETFDTSGPFYTLIWQF